MLLNNECRKLNKDMFFSLFVYQKSYMFLKLFFKIQMKLNIRTQCLSTHVGTFLKKTNNLHSS